MVKYFYYSVKVRQNIQHSSSILLSKFVIKSLLILIIKLRGTSTLTESRQRKCQVVKIFKTDMTSFFSSQHVSLISISPSYAGYNGCLPTFIYKYHTGQQLEWFIRLAANLSPPWFGYFAFALKFDVALIFVARMEDALKETSSLRET